MKITNKNQSSEVKNICVSLPSLSRNFDSTLNIKVTIESLKLLLFQCSQIPETFSSIQKKVNRVLIKRFCLFLFKSCKTQIIFVLNEILNANCGL